MLLVIDNETIINVDTIRSMIIKHTPRVEKKQVSSFFGFFPVYEEVSIPSYTLEFEYENKITPNTVWTFSSKNDDRTVVRKMAKLIVEEIRRNDPTMINAAFEKAFLE